MRVQAASDYTPGSAPPGRYNDPHNRIQADGIVLGSIGLAGGSKLGCVRPIGAIESGSEGK